MTLIRFEGTSDRGPSGTLWNHLVDWPKGTLQIAQGAVFGTDFFPYNAGDITLSADSGSAATVQAVPFGVVAFAASQAADAVSGFTANCYVDFTAITEVCLEADVDSVDDDASTITFVGFTDEALDGIFGTDNALDGSSFGLLWNADETVDLVAVSASDVVTIVSAALATIERTTGPHKLGLRVKQISSTQYTVFASVNGAVTTVNTTTSVVPQAAMAPALVHTNDNEAAPNVKSDWFFCLDATQG